jgi:hypothetical protein
MKKCVTHSDHHRLSVPTGLPFLLGWTVTHKLRVRNNTFFQTALSDTWSKLQKKKKKYIYIYIYIYIKQILKASNNRIEPFTTVYLSKLQKEPAQVSSQFMSSTIHLGRSLKSTISWRSIYKSCVSWKRSLFISSAAVANQRPGYSNPVPHWVGESNRKIFL